LFDRHRRALRRARATGDDYLGRVMAEAIIERIDDISRPFATATIIGARASIIIDALTARGVAVTSVEASAALASHTGALHADEDRLPLDPASQDLIVWSGGLDSINDVPGALLRCRLALKPDGVLVGCFSGDGSFPALRAALAAADGDRPVARMHPQIDGRAMGDLLGKVGLALPVIDIDRLSLAYRSLDALVSDLRAAALTNMLAGPLHPLTRDQWAMACAAFAAAGEDGRTAETVRIIHFTGWAPDPSQPQPARRGSATASLAAALKPRDQAE
jgi:SAM-dependent methyltransferase